MSVGDFTNKAKEPPPTEIAAALGSKLALWEEMLAWFQERRGVKTDLHFYGVSYGWALRVRSGGRALLSLYPGHEHITAQMILPLHLTDAALALALGPDARGAILAANPYAEGRWLFVPLDGEQQVQDLRRLLELKLGKPFSASA
jgi:hypothetical protein